MRRNPAYTILLALCDSSGKGNGMRRILKNTINTLIVLAAILILIQPIQVDRTNPPVQSDIPAEPDIKPILQRSCYNCHSNETDWPWYSYIAPASWLTVNTVRNGRSHLNFSEWESYAIKMQYRKLEDIAEEAIGKEMPPWYYVIMREEADLTVTDRGQVWAWAVTESETLF